MIVGNSIKMVKVWLVLLALLLTAAPASGSYHLWQVSEVFSTADGEIQFIEFFNFNGGEQFLKTFNVEVTRTGGSGFFFPTDLPVPGVQPTTANKSFLVGTPSYAAFPGAAAPDYVLPSDNFFDVSGDTLRLDGDVFGICCSVTYGSGALPTDGLNSLIPGGGAQLNTPTNFAGQTGFVPEPATAAILACGSVMLLGRPRRHAAARRE